MRIQTTDITRKIGFEFEQEAVEFLLSKGYEIIKTNFVYGRVGEIDIIAKDKDYLVFVEVRFRKDNSYGGAEYSITPSKIKKIRIAAEAFLYINKIQNQNCRFDFIGISKVDSKLIFNHLINAF
ncbi:MAG TPA: YraN family protein [Candidatus Kapabacteria bacterium]|nr:YraN family protein [Candidatus Kapabacteria bacterium]